MYMCGKCKWGRSNKVITYLVYFVLSICQADMNLLSFYIFSQFLEEFHYSLPDWSCFVFFILFSSFSILFFSHHFLDSWNLTVGWDSLPLSFLQSTLINSSSIISVNDEWSIKLLPVISWTCSFIYYLCNRWEVNHLCLTLYAINHLV